MMRHLTTLVVVLLAAGSAPAADTKDTVIRWYGQSFFTVTSTKGVTVAFDPHSIEAYGRNQIKADIVLCSHMHNDHTQTDVIITKDKKVLYGLKGKEGKEDWNKIKETIRGIPIRTVGTYHDESQGLERGKNSIFIVEIDGLRIVHLGDLGHELSKEQIKEIGPVDILMIPVGGVYTINGTDAKKVVEQLNPKKYIFPMHYGTKVFDDVLTPDEFIEDQKNVKKLTVNKFSISKDLKKVSPDIVLMHWKEEKKDD